MSPNRRFRFAAVLTVVGLASPLFWLGRRFLTHPGPVPGPGVQSQYVYWFFLASAAVATLACGGAIGLAVPLLLRDPALRTPTRIASSTAAALTGLLLLTFWVSAFWRIPGILSYLLFVGLAPGIPVVLILRAARRFRAESPKRRAILGLAVALLALWAGASTVNFFALWADPEQHGRMMLYLTLTYAAFGSGLVMVMREARPRAWALVVGSAVAYVAIPLLGLAA
jgi:hypothetical protein